MINGCADAMEGQSSESTTQSGRRIDNCGKSLLDNTTLLFVASELAFMPSL